MRCTGGWGVAVGCLLAFYLGNVCLVLGLSQNELKNRKSSPNKLLNSTVEPGHASALYSQHEHQEAIIDTDHHGACCSRHHKFAAIGFGVSGEAVQLDIGHCRRSCKKPHLDSLSLLDPAGTDIAQQEADFYQPCPSHHVCTPTESRLQRVSTMHGIEEVEVIGECACAAKPNHCARQPHHVVIFPGTPYETRLDMGACAGHCNHNLGCHALRNETVSAAGPNGAQLHSVVRECGCTGGCYRATLKETVFDFSEGEHNATNAPVVKDIDVGQCVGACEAGGSRKCVFRDRDDPTRCLAGLYSGRRAGCAPAQYEIHRYTTRQRQTREIIAITECRCT